MTIKEEIKGVGYEKLPAVGLLAPKMMDFILSMKELGFSINAIRIVLILSANMKEKQMLFRGKNKDIQLELFDNEWMDVDNDKAYSVQLNFKFKDFLPKGSKNYSLVRKGLDELQEKNFLLEFPKKEENGRIRKIQLKSAFISSYIMEEGNGFKMIINNFWYKALIDVSNSFNTYMKPIIFNLSYNSVLFYMYLKTLPFIKGKEYEELRTELGNALTPAKGTRIKKENFVKMFGADYIYNSDIKRKLIEPMISELNQVADLSSGYRIDDDIITLVTYDMTSNAVENNLINVEEAKIKSALNYKLKNSGLDKNQAMYLLEIYLKYTYKVVFKATERKSILRGLKGQTYCDAFLQLVDAYVRKERININEVGYQNINEMRSNLRKGYIDK